MLINILRDLQEQTCGVSSSDVFKENFRKILQNTLATASLCLNFSPYLAGTSKNQKNIFAEFKTFIQLTIPSIEKSS